MEKMATEQNLEKERQVVHVAEDDGQSNFMNQRNQEGAEHSLPAAKKILVIQIGFHWTCGELACFLARCNLYRHCPSSEYINNTISSILMLAY